MATNNNGQRAENFTSGAVLDKHLSKVVIPSGKNAELLNSVREIVAAGVRDIYGDSSEKKYIKIVDLIMKRVNAALEDSSIQSGIEDLQASFDEQAKDLSSELKSIQKTISKSDNSKQTTQLTKLLNDVKKQIVSARKEQQKELNDFKDSIKTYVNDLKSELAEAVQSTAKEAEQKPKEQPAPVVTSAKDGTSEQVISIVSQLKSTIETMMSTVLTEMQSMQLSINSQFSSMALSMSSMSTVLNTMVTTSSQGFNDINKRLQSINQTLENTITSNSSNFANEKLDRLMQANEQWFLEISDSLTTSTREVVSTIESQIDSIRDKISTSTGLIIAAIASKESAMASAIAMFFAAFSAITSAVKRSVSRLTNTVKSAVNSTSRTFRKITKSISFSFKNFFKAHENSVLKKIFSGIGYVFLPIVTLSKKIFGMMSIIFKPLKWILGILTSPAKLLFLAAAVYVMWPYIKGFISEWWSDVIKPVYDWISDKLSAVFGFASDAVSSWWTGLWEKHGGFYGYLTNVAIPAVGEFFEAVAFPRLILLVKKSMPFITDVVLPKIGRFFTETVWPPIWNFLKNNWKSMLMSLGIFAFLSNPMHTLMLALRIPVLLLRAIQATVSLVKLIGLGLKFAVAAQHAIVAALPAIIAALPIVLPIAIAAAVFGAMFWKVKAEFDELREQQEQDFKDLADISKRNFDKNEKIWKENDYQTKIDSILSTVGRVDANTTKLLEIQNVKLAQSEEYTYNGTTFTGAQLEEVIKKEMSKDMMMSNKAMKRTSGGKTYSISLEDAVAGFSNDFEGTIDTKLKAAFAASENEPKKKNKIAENEIKLYNQLKSHANFAMAYVSFMYDYAGRMAQNFAKDISNWSGNDPTISSRIKTFNEWFVSSKDMYAESIISAMNRIVPGKIDDRWTLGLDEASAQLITKKLWSSTRNLKTEIHSNLKTLMTNPAASKEDQDALSSDIEKAMSAAGSQFAEIGKQNQSGSNGEAIGFNTLSFKETMDTLNSKLGENSAFANANGYAGLESVRKRVDLLESLKNSAFENLYAEGLEKRFVSDGSVDDRYLKQLQNSLVNIGVSGGRNGKLSIEDEIAAYNASLVNARKELESMDDKDPNKKRLTDIVNALDKHVKKLDDSTGNTALANIRKNARKDEWDSLSASERGQYGNNFEAYHAAKEGGTVIINQNNITNNNGQNVNSVDTSVQ